MEGTRFIPGRKPRRLRAPTQSNPRLAWNGGQDRYRLLYAEAIDGVKEAASRVENAPVIFPGVELTASDGSHLLSKAKISPSERGKAVIIAARVNAPQGILAVQLEKLQRWSCPEYTGIPYQSFAPTFPATCSFTEARADIFAESATRSAKWIPTRSRAAPFQIRTAWSAPA